jgi:hypothetical protein
MVHVSVQVVSSYVTPWLSNTCLISVISFVVTLYNAEEHHSTTIGIFFKLVKIGTCRKDSNKAEIYSKEFWNANLVVNL